MTQQHLLFLKLYVYDRLINIIQRIKDWYVLSDYDERFNEGISYFHIKPLD